MALTARIVLAYESALLLIQPDISPPFSLQLRNTTSTECSFVTLEACSAETKASCAVGLEQPTMLRVFQAIDSGSMFNTAGLPEGVPTTLRDSYYASRPPIASLNPYLKACDPFLLYCI